MPIFNDQNDERAKRRLDSIDPLKVREHKEKKRYQAEVVEHNNGKEYRTIVDFTLDEVFDPKEQLKILASQWYEWEQECEVCGEEIEPLKIACGECGETHSDAPTWDGSYFTFPDGIMVEPKFETIKETPLPKLPIKPKTRIVVCVSDGTLTVHSSSKDIEIEIFDFDWPDIDEDELTSIYEAAISDMSELIPTISQGEG